MFGHGPRDMQSETNQVKMSKAFTPSSNPYSSSFFARENALESSSAANGQLSVPFPGHSVNTGLSPPQVPNWRTTSAARKAKVKQRTPEENDIVKRVSSRVADSLAVDHAAVLHPDADTPFSDIDDIIKRLLPYHVFQHPKDDLDFSKICKGKEKAIEHDLKTEIEATEFAIECYKRRNALRDRLSKLKERTAKRSSPSSQAYVLAQVILEADRTEVAWLNNELRNARGELERLEREKRATANPVRMSQFSATPPQGHSIQPQYYRGYPYAYTQVYGTPMQANPTFSAVSTPSATATPSVNYTPYQSGGAIPVQLPVASLPALHALGIVPIPASSVPPEGQPQPPAVLRGSTANGTMLSLEINVSLLQSAQMSGLAMVLNSLMSRGNGSSSSTTGTAGTTQLPSPTVSGTKNVDS